MMEKRAMNPIQYLLVIIIGLYRLFLSPIKNALYGPTGSCRFTPSCSSYALEAIKTYGAIKGTALGISRILRCNPWGNHGHDPVPEKQLKFERSNNNN